MPASTVCTISVEVAIALRDLLDAVPGEYARRALPLPGMRRARSAPRRRYTPFRAPEAESRVPGLKAPSRALGTSVTATRVPSRDHDSWWPTATVVAGQIRLIG